MKHRLVLSTLCISLSIPSLAFAHGWVEFPSARQNTCYLDGGFWSNAIPNAACQAVYDQSGAYPFVQRNEVAANVARYRDLEQVKAVIPDGQLCSAGHAAKAGLNIVSPHWQKTPIQLNEHHQLDLVFHAAVPHNPSYWEFYLTKPEYDPSLPLTWDDLELIDEAGNVAVGADRKYRFTVNFPEGRSGDAILYTRWQRIDPAGEGFYNCSDITFVGGEAPTPPTEPSEPEQPTDLTALGYFVPTGFGPVDSGDSVRFRTFSQQGQELTDIHLEISANNTHTWPVELAGQFNQQQAGHWYIGIWHQEMNHYMFDSRNIHVNQVFAPHGQFSYQLSLQKQTPPPVIPDNAWQESKIYTAGDIVIHQGREWTAQWWTRGEEPGATGEWGVWR
ncbi:lytic polysaccharide monooxygenase [Vibrio metschnikovii]|uniref:lytic polysaccharide monooxygenase n=1 Tax=Vibrio metschnikovii TaxID=28172 RepID=UPI00164684C1|nr:lytic polysaccharide monooxygenase [Vibrio metschnikovii]MBC3617171.1 lytic polysaccharide monooxygenase [Vibrio metschnikovii]MBC5813094.1 lytic polysaccharide monooxygenase [Vibrio metschnikovii]